MNLNRTYLKIVAETSGHKRITFQGAEIEGIAELKLFFVVKNSIFKHFSVQISPKEKKELVFLK